MRPWSDTTSARRCDGVAVSISAAGDRVVALHHCYSISIWRLTGDVSRLQFAQHQVVHPSSLAEVPIVWLMRLSESPCGRYVLLTNDPGEDMYDARFVQCNTTVIDTCPSVSMLPTTAKLWHLSSCGAEAPPRHARLPPTALHPTPSAIWILARDDLRHRCDPATGSTYVATRLSCLAFESP